MGPAQSGKIVAHASRRIAERLIVLHPGGTVAFGQLFTIGAVNQRDMQGTLPGASGLDVEGERVFAESEVDTRV